MSTEPASDDTSPSKEETVESSLIFTPAGSFKVDGSVHETLRRLAAEEWPVFTLTDNQQSLAVRSAKVAAIQHVREPRGKLGFRL
jgi:hypothetical protein